ncbi:recombinase family protein [Luteolibacter sp. LG18]|uniref:recombinase family protein n=1 Tax=Luteolibacter sp. LG18 TaxID=2819286 RepID=UPI002B2A0D07|nr:hypothetical protein llg_11130 [Luteolibacter sp. LG18]
MFSILTELGGQAHPRLRALRLHRVSTADQAADDRGGLERQRIETSRIVRDKDYLVVETQEISDVSGTAFFESPEGEHLLQLARAKSIDVVVVSELSRLVRIESLSAFVYLGVLQENNVIVDAGGVHYDFASDSGFLGAGVLALVSGWERRAALARISQAKNALRAKGLCPSSPITLPLGVVYDRPAGRFRYEEPSILKVKEAFRLMDEEGLRNYSEIGRQVGIAAPTLRNLLRNRIYAGIRDYLKMRDPKRKRTRAGARQGDRPKIDRPKDQVISVRVFPMDEQAVSDDRFERVQAIIREISEHQRHVNPNGKVTNLGSGLLYCSCGERIYTVTSSRRTKDGVKARGYYLCRSKYYLFRKKLQSSCTQAMIPKERMDEVIELFAASFLENPEFAKAVLSQAESKSSGTAGPRSSVAGLEKRLADLERREQRLLDAVEAGVIDLAQAKVRKARIAAEREALTANSSAGLSEIPVPVDNLHVVLSGGSTAWKALATTADRKAILSRMFTSIQIMKGRIISYRLASGLIASDHPVWGPLTDDIITLEEPFPPKEPSAEVPEHHRRCTACRQVLHESAFYRGRARCIGCFKIENQRRYQETKVAKKGS